MTKSVYVLRTNAGYLFSLASISKSAAENQSKNSSKIDIIKNVNDTSKQLLLLAENAQYTSTLMNVYKHQPT